MHQVLHIKKNKFRVFSRKTFNKVKEIEILKTCVSRSFLRLGDSTYYLWIESEKEYGDLYYEWRFYIHPYGQDYRSLTFEELLDEVPKDIQMQLLFHLDLFA